MTIAQVEALLKEESIPDGFLESCAEDPRTAVQKALAKRGRRAQRQQKELQRLDSLSAKERRLAELHGKAIGGVDEAGRGPLAGPVVAACVVLPRDHGLEGLDDSKKLTPAGRERLEREIRRVARGIGIGIVDNEQIDRDNILNASLAAMAAAVRSCEPTRPGYLLVDALRIPGVPLQQEAIIRGDSLCACIAAASIIAKVTRDRLMVELDRKHPGYGLAEHKGYGTPFHLERLRALGPSPIHRRSFAPVRDADPLRRADEFRALMDRAQSIAELTQAGRAFAGQVAGLRSEFVDQLRVEYRRRLAELSDQTDSPPPMKPPPGKADSVIRDPATGEKRMGRTERGRLAEDEASRFLECHGYRIMERNFRAPTGEIDLICDHRGCLVFVEVRSKSSKVFGDPAESLTAAKRHRLTRTASLYIAHRGLTNRPCRFDLITLSRKRRDRNPSFKIIQDVRLW